MKVEIEIQLDNDDAVSNGEFAIARYMEDIKAAILRGETNGYVRDLNGNTIGTFKIC